MVSELLCTTQDHETLLESSICDWGQACGKERGGLYEQGGEQARCDSLLVVIASPVSLFGTLVVTQAARSLVKGSRGALSR